MGPAPLWKNQIKLPDNHRIFQATHHCYIGALPAVNAEDQRGIWGMADDSGNYPHDTDDGVLWLDFTRDLRAGSPARGDQPITTPGIPLLDSAGKMCHTITDTCTMLALSIRFAWHINAMGKLVQAIEV